MATTFFPLKAEAIIFTMRTLDLYIGRSFLRYFIFIAAILLILFSLLELISQLDDVGKGGYKLPDALMFVALTLPKRLLDLMPISTLLGGLLALGMMADHGELVAMEASGISTRRIGGAALATGMVLMALAGILAELVVPGMEQMARNSRAQALSKTDVTLTRQGFWARTGDRYVHVDKMLDNGVAADISLFKFDKTGRLQSFVRAENGRLGNDGSWNFTCITEKTITDNEVTTTRRQTLTLEFFLSADQVRILELPPYSLSTPDLVRYIDALRQSGQNPDQYIIALWRKFTIPLTTGAMVLLSLSFVFGSTRNISAGYRVTSGTLLGIVLYFSDQILIQWGMLLNLPPGMTATLPILLISGIAFARLRNVR